MGKDTVRVLLAIINFFWLSWSAQHHKLPRKRPHSSSTSAGFSLETKRSWKVINIFNCMSDIMDNEAPLQFTINTLHIADDPWPIEWMMFNILNEYLQPNTEFSLTDAAMCLDALMPENRPAWLRQGIDSVDDCTHELFDLVWKIAKQIHCQHRGQDKLINLLKALPFLYITQTVVNSSGEQVPAWAEFGHWDDRSQMRRALKPPIKNCSPSQRICDQYVNASAFAARFFTAARLHALYAAYSPVRRLGRRLALNTIETAVGGNIPNIELLPCHYIAAAQWIILAGEWLWSDIRWGRVSYYEVPDNDREYLALAPPRWVR